MKEQVYKDPRPAEHFERFHRRTRTKRPNWMYEVVRMVLTPYLFLLYRSRCIDSDNVPADGGAIIAPNHFSYLDHFFVAVYLRRKVHFMAKSQLFNMPMEIIYNNGGVFPVRAATSRGLHNRPHPSAASSDVREAGRSHGDRGKPAHGVGRSRSSRGAGDTTAIAGTERVRNWKRLNPQGHGQFGERAAFEAVEETTAAGSAA